MPKLSAEEERLRQEKMWEIEKSLKEKGYKYIAGEDEAGRGPLAGPVYAAAVILPEDAELSGINDSKKLTPKKREELFDKIIDVAISYSIFSVDEKEIDEINILNATHKAMNGAVNGLTQKPDYVIIDGNSIKGMGLPHETVVKGDAKSISIEAASILAKVARDRYIDEMGKVYPE